MLASSDSVAADGAQDGREAELRAGGDDTVGDHVVEGLERETNWVRRRLIRVGNGKSGEKCRVFLAGDT